MRYAVRTIRGMPVRIPTSANTELSDWAIASHSERAPAYSPSKLCTTKSSLPPLCGTGNSFCCELQTESGEYPFWSAAARVNALKEEPGWRWPCVARLKEECL